MSGAKLTSWGLVKLLMVISLSAALASASAGEPPPELTEAGVTTFGFGKSVSPSEAFSSQRTRIFPFACPPTGQVKSSVFPKKFVGINSVVTRGPDELYLLGGTAAKPHERSDSDLPPEAPYLSKLKPSTMEEEWCKPLQPEPHLLDWRLAGNLALTQENNLLAIFSNYAVLVDGDTGDILARNELPVSNNSTLNDTSYNGFVILSDGTVAAKSLHRRPGCKEHGMRALSELFPGCGPPSSNTIVVLLNGTTLEVLQVLDTRNVFGGRPTSSMHNNQEFYYSVGASGNMIRYLYAKGKLWQDASWTASLLPPDGSITVTGGPSAVIPMNGWLIATTNTVPSPVPLLVAAVWQDNPEIVIRVQPFKDRYPLTGDEVSWAGTSPSVDPLTQTVFVGDYIAGQVAALRLSAAGFQQVWAKPGYNLDFTTLLGSPGKYVYVHSNVSGIEGKPVSTEILYPAVFDGQTLVYRHADTGEVIAESGMLDLSVILAHVPGFDGNYFFLSSEVETLTKLTYDVGACNSDQATSW